MTKDVDIRELLKLALPSIVFTVLTHGYRSVDQFWIQDVSVEAQAAIGASVFVLITFSGAFEILGTGAAPLVARATGAKDDEARRKSLGAAIFGAILLYIVSALIGAFGAELLAAAVGLSGETANQAAIYMRTIAITSLPLVLTPLVDLCFIATGRARLPMLLHAISLGFNLVLTPLFIFQLDFGIAGAALASNLARGIATGIGLFALARVTGLRWSDIRPSPELTRVIKVGAPMGTGTILYAFVYWAVLKTSISPIGPHANAALGIGFSALEGVTWPCFHGVGLAVSSFVGRALGANRPSDGVKALKLAVPIVFTMGATASAVFFFGGDFLTGLFASDPEVHRAATEYAVILAASQLFVAFESLFEGVLAGAGDTRTVFWLSVPVNILRVPLCWLFAFPLGFGAAGVWWAINLTTYVKAISKGVAAYRGRWKTLEI